jgi:hypothetical protein
MTDYSGTWEQRVPKELHAELAKLAKREGVDLNLLVTTMLAEAMGRWEILSALAATPTILSPSKKKKAKNQKHR